MSYQIRACCLAQFISTAVSRACFARTSAGAKLDVIFLANLESPYIFTYNERQTITSPPKTPPLTPHFKNSSSSATNCQNDSNTHRAYFWWLFDCIFVCFALVYHQKKYVCRDICYYCLHIVIEKTSKHPFVH